jgi:hypothetical protein
LSIKGRKFLTKNHCIQLELYMTLMILIFSINKAEKFLAKNNYILLELYMTLLILILSIKGLKVPG